METLAKTRGSYVELTTSYANASKCQSILGGKWDKKNNCWVYPGEALEFMIPLFPDIKVDKELNEYLTTLFRSIERTTGLINGTIQPAKHDFLLLHQRKCRDIAKIRNKWAFFCDTGTGKTILAYAIIKDKLTIVTKIKIKLSLFLLLSNSIDITSLFNLSISYNNCNSLNFSCNLWSLISNTFLFYSSKNSFITF